MQCQLDHHHEQYQAHHQYLYQSHQRFSGHPLQVGLEQLKLRKNIIIEISAFTDLNILTYTCCDYEPQAHLHQGGQVNVVVYLPALMWKQQSQMIVNYLVAAFYLAY